MNKPNLSIPDPKSKKRTRWLSNLAVLVVAVVITLIVLEFAVRLVYRRTNRIKENRHGETIHIPDDKLTYTHRPNYEGEYINAEYEITIHTNSHGLRDQEYDYEKREGVFRILVLGDSFMAGMEVEEPDTMQAQLEALLNADPRTANSGISFEVINGGVAGYTALTNYLFLHYEGFKYEPDLVLYAMMYNDTYGLIGDTAPDVEGTVTYAKADQDGHLQLDQDGKPILITEQVAWKPGEWPDDLPQAERLDSQLNQYSELYKRVVGPVIKRTRPVRTLLFNAFLRDDLPLFTNEHYTINPEEEGFLEGVNALNDLVVLMRDGSYEHGACYTSIVIPDILRIQPDLVKDYYIGFNLASDHWQWDKTDQLMADIYTKSDIPYLLMSDVFIPLADEELYFPMDRHWTEHGHEVAAEAVYEWLIESNLIPTTDQSTYQQCSP